MTPLASAAFSADGENIVVQEVNGYLTLFNIETGLVIRKYPASETETKNVAVR